MSEFNINLWLKDQYLNEAGLGSSKSQSLAIAINSSINDIDENLPHADFAEAVASVLISEFGQQNFDPFMEVLHARLGMNESLNEQEDNTLAKEISSLFGGNPYVDMNNGYGEIEFRVKGEFEDSKWSEILDFIKSKNLTITSDSNYYDMEPGEREWFPKILFNSK